MNFSQLAWLAQGVPELLVQHLGFPILVSRVFFTEPHRQFVFLSLETFLVQILRKHNDIKNIFS